VISTGIDALRPGDGRRMRRLGATAPGPGAIGCLSAPRRCATLAAWLALAALLLARGGPVLAATDASELAAQRLIDRYIEAWADFYPSRAFAYGRLESAPFFEDYRAVRVSAWLALNRDAQAQSRAILETRGDLSPARRTDLRVLLAQTENELGNWREDEPLARQPQWYAEQMSQALTHLLVRDRLTEQARSDALLQRLLGVQRLCDQALAGLEGGNALRTRRAIGVLEGLRAFYAGNLRELIASWPPPAGERGFDAVIDDTLERIEALEARLRNDILPEAGLDASIGVGNYEAKLARRTHGAFRSITLLNAVAVEMRSVRSLMMQEAARWRDSLEDGPRKAALVDADEAALLGAAIEAMESARQGNSADFLASFTELTFAAERFVEENEIASIPKPTTLHIDLSPAHFSGAAVGGVYPSGPFAPDAATLFYVPSISDSAPEAAKEGFYRSFNTHFNTMILAHEMFPGHYLQYKVAVSEAPALRSLFPNGSYVEGWGSFVEELMLDAGWAGNAPLTRLAHLRKRLENATRAYVSVQVNTAGWGEDEVSRFAREEGLLAPQFATNLWHRVVNSPLQITDYFTGSRQFRRMFDAYRRGGWGDTAPDVRPWVDAVLRAGPLPMVLLEGELRRHPGER
jgi:uncharacterized protein (DUF885 family)